jgi:16S rRNA (cytosine1402-N4)-methyltransferase
MNIDKMIRQAILEADGQVRGLNFEDQRDLLEKGRLNCPTFEIKIKDRIVKRFIRNESGRKYNPGKLPIKETDIEHGLLQKIGKAISATKQEVELNPRARSAIMRIAEKV